MTSPFLVVEFCHLKLAHPQFQYSCVSRPTFCLRFNLLTIILPYVNFKKTCVAISTFTMASEIAFFSLRLLSFSLFFNHFTNPPLELSAGTARISKALTCPRFGLDGQVISFFWWLKFPLLAIILDILVDWYIHWFPFSVELITCCVFLAFFWGFLLVVRFLCEGVTIHWQYQGSQ